MKRLDQELSCSDGPAIKPRTLPETAACVFLLHLHDAIARFVDAVFTGPILERGLGAAVQWIVDIGCRLALSIEHRRQVAVVVVGVGLGPE